MAEKPAAERTEQPTPRALRKAKEQGRVAQSQELPSAVSIVILVLILALMGPALMDWFAEQMKQGILCNTAVFSDSSTFMNFVGSKVGEILLVVCPVFAALFAGSVLSCMAVSGPNFATKALTLKWSSINPAKGLERLFDARSAVRLCVSVTKLLFVSLVVWLYLRSRLDVLATLRWAWSAEIVGLIAKIILGMMIRVCIALLAIAGADVFYQKTRHLKDLKMTRQEVKQDRKDTDGSPEVKSRVRRIQIEMARKRMLEEVPKASVVLVNPTHVAVAIRYEAKTMESPVVVAKGAGHMSEKIREIARAYGVPVLRRPELARTIYSTVEPGNSIPPALYVAVAEVLAMIYRMRHKSK